MTTVPTSPHASRTRRLVVRPTADGHRVTTFELFFDLVFVFAVTQVTGHIVHSHTGLGLVQGGVLLGLLWWAWSSYTWLGNQAHADVGALRIGMVAAMTAVFVLAISVPEAWHDEPGGLHGPTVLAVAFIVIRLIHEGLYLLAAGSDRALRHQLALNLVPLMAAGTLLLTGATTDDRTRTALWASALAVDWVLTYFTSMRGRGWRINSIDHWVERHGLVVILALGESVVAVGVGAAGMPLHAELLVAASLGIVVAAALWWLYFDVSAGAAERALHRRDAEGRVRAAIEAYTYLHYWSILGIVLTAVGIEETLTHVMDSEPLGAFTAGCLTVGPAMYLAGNVLSWIRLASVVKTERLVAIAVLLTMWPIATAAPPLVALALVAAGLVALVGFESVKYADVRSEMRAAQT